MTSSGLVSGTRTHHIHMVEADFEHWDRLLFRDYLIEHPDVAREYSDLKEKLSEQARMLKEIDPDYYSPSFYTPHPGSDLYDYCIEHDLSLITSHDQYRRNPWDIKIKGQDHEFLQRALEESQRRTPANAARRKAAYLWGRYAVEDPQRAVTPGQAAVAYDGDLVLGGGWITPEEDMVRNSLMINGEWNKVRVLAIGPKIQTWINGEQVSDLTVPSDVHERYSKVVIALQAHGVKNPEEKTRHVSFRSIRVRTIELAK